MVEIKKGGINSYFRYETPTVTRTRTQHDDDFHIFVRRMRSDHRVEFYLKNVSILITRLSSYENTMMYVVFSYNEKRSDDNDYMWYTNNHTVITSLFVVRKYNDNNYEYCMFVQWKRSDDDDDILILPSIRTVDIH